MEGGTAIRCSQIQKLAILKGGSLDETFSKCIDCFTVLGFRGLCSRKEGRRQERAPAAESKDAKAKDGKTKEAKAKDAKSGEKTAEGKTADEKKPAK